MPQVQVLGGGVLRSVGGVSFPACIGHRVPKAFFAVRSLYRARTYRTIESGLRRPLPSNAFWPDEPHQYCQPAAGRVSRSARSRNSFAALRVGATHTSVVWCRTAPSFLPPASTRSQPRFQTSKTGSTKGWYWTSTRIWRRRL